MEIEHLREFLVYSKTLNYTTAAKELYIAQPTLCQHIAKLSNDLGVPLVSQEGRPHLTPQGDILCSYAQAILSNYERLRSTLEKMDMGEDRAIRIVDIRESVDFSPEIRKNRKESPESGIAVEYIGDKTLFQKTEFEVLDAGLADISFTFAAPDDPSPFDDDIYAAYEFLSLPDQAGKVVLGWNNPLAEKERLESAELAPLQVATVKTPFWIRSEQALLSCLQAAGIGSTSVQGSARSKFILPPPMMASWR
ncbi:LysR family transcriptional regulator [Adlercreutzia shanghongiae]|uniref:LysR family transcriptional regulator n=1 Tax=Adlercreutzia shanghongiae TaxID=3111773 RepID=A0ABU6IY33_9ACTN|nr:LysR family transcriptional regulator [Adlercreutzia sp. R22]MEC4294767.1 LysR family transcriptional regulator [Adlercreutzia sp. R22]